MDLNIPRFTLDEAKLREWLNERITDDFFVIDEDWKPREDEGIGSTVDDLLDELIPTGILAHPWPKSRLYADHSGSDHLAYCLDLFDPRPNVETWERKSIRLSTEGYEARKVGNGDFKGVDAAIDVLKEMVGYANDTIDRLEAFASILPAAQQPWGEEPADLNTYTVEVTRSIMCTVEVEARTPHEALEAVQRADYPLPPVEEWSGSKDWEFAVFDADGAELIDRDGNDVEG